MEGANSSKATISRLLLWTNRYSHVASLWVHHSMNALAVDNQSNTNARTNCNVAQTFLDALILTSFSLRELKHGRHVHIRVEEHSLAAIFGVEAQALGKASQHREVLPGHLWSRSDVAVCG